ncbi:MAG TPA: trypsin-like peptidase domain-containing protein [Verrucomicrobiales bacterium]|nr:trypsin-like peptidase domain-containing protein [Verrucomicrobiales bacterium]
MRRVLFGTAAFAAAFGALWLIDHQIFQPRETEKPETVILEQRSKVDPGLLPVSTALNNEMAMVTERVMPSVVSIQVQRRRMVPETVLHGGEHRTETREVPERGVGSGTIIGKEGHILTNWHVVEGGEAAILVTLSGEESARPATLVDKDDQRDLALLKIVPRRDGEQFPALHIGDSGKLRPGHMVLAMGSPFGLRETVTNGIISHCARRVSDTYTSYLQTNCVINPGNSGGPLVNLEGDMVGIVTRKLLGPEDQASSEGYGLAIPSNDLLLALDSLMYKDRPQPYLGIMVEDWPESYWLKQKDPEAVIVKGVDKNSPAEKAGLKMNDVIESLDGEKIAHIYDFWRRVRLHKSGDSLDLTVRRGRDAKPEHMQAVLTGLPESPSTPGVAYGVHVRKLHSYERNLLNILDGSGLRVEEVEPKSPLVTILTRGMNVLLVATPDGTTALTVSSPEEFRKALEDLAGTGGNVIVASPGGVNKPLKFPPLK